MCYDTAQLAYRIYRDAIRLKASQLEIEELKNKWERIKEGAQDYYHASGYSHPKLAAFIHKENKIDINRYRWGLIPHWVKNEEQAAQIQNKTINARGETIFEKPSFRDAAKNSRCVIPLDGFYEHYHKEGKSFPFFIRRKDKKRMFVGGLAARWVNEATGEIIDSMSIITTPANSLLRLIHNNPKVKESRMPLILEDNEATLWLKSEQNEVMKLIKPNECQLLEAYPIKKLRGKEYIGNVKEIIVEEKHVELEDLNKQLK